jgi:hypothetical protein
MLTQSVRRFSTPPTPHARASLQAGLRVVAPMPSGPGCDAIEIERLTGAVDLPLARVTVLDDDRAHVAGPTDAAAANDPMIRGRVDGLVVTVFATRDELRGRPNELAHDPGGRIHAVTGRPLAPRGPLEVWDADGASLPSPDLLGRSIGAITIDTLGWRYPYGRSALLAIAPGSERAEVRPEHPWPVIWAFAVRPDLIGTYDGFALRVFDGAVWREERTMEAFESVSRMGGDADALIAVGPREQVYWRETSAGRWQTLPLPFDQGVNFRGVAAVGGGRFVAAGTQGRIGVWMGGRWCTVETGGITDFHGAAASPSGRTVYVVGEDPAPARDGDPVWAFRLRMPDP